MSTLDKITGMSWRARFNVLGPVEAEVGGRPVALPDRLRRLLAALLVHRNELTPMGHLVTAVWPGTPHQINTVEVYVSRLRRLLPEASIETRSGCYRLVVGPDALDADRFEADYRAGCDHLLREEAESAIEAFDRALAQWSGPAYSGVGDPAYFAGESERLHEMRVGCQAMWVEARLYTGEAGSLISELRGLVDVHPLREQFWAQLMVTLYRMGRPADALRAFRILRSRLHAEVGLLPGSAINNLAELVLARDPALDSGGSWPKAMLPRPPATTRPDREAATLADGVYQEWSAPAQDDSPPAAG